MQIRSLAAGTKRAPGTSRSTRPLASKNPAPTSGTFQPAGRTVPASTTPILPSSLTPMSPPASCAPVSPVMRNRRAASRIVRRSVGEENATQLEQRHASRPEGPVAGRRVE